MAVPSRVRDRDRMRSHGRHISVFALLLFLALLAGACSGDGSDDTLSSEAPPGATVDDETGLNDHGVVLASDLADEAPHYRLTGSVDAEAGQVEGTVEADLPMGASDRVNLRFFPALVDPSASVDEVTVAGEEAEFELDSSLLTVTLDAEHDDRIELSASFSYEIPETPEADILGGLGSLFGEDSLQPAEIGLLGRRDGVVSLGHWFPMWIPEGLSAEPTPDGFGDIGNYPAAVLQAEVEVPEGWTLVSGGVRAGEDGDQVVEAATGLRDLGMVLLEDPETVETTVGDTTVRVVAASDTEASILDEVADEAAMSLEVLSEAFGTYPWTELDVVATPLGSGVGGMEWPGMVWIEESIFAGGLPGMGDLGDLGDLGGMGLDSDVLGETRAWTIAHEVGHEWWHAVVGNDSIISPAVDEPLAQYSACTVFQRAWPDNADAVCEFNTSGGYEQMRSFGVEDAPAAQPSEDFDSSLQYGGVVYGKAPGVYSALAEEFGEDAVVEALAGVVTDHAFEQISVEDLHVSLANRLGDAATVATLWERWMEGTFGDEDLGVDPNQAGGLGDLGDLGDLGSLEDAEDLEDLLARSCVGYDE